MATPLIPFTLAWLVGIWLASRAALPTLALGIAASVAILGALRYNLAQPRFDSTSLATYNDQYRSMQAVYSSMYCPGVTVLARDQGFARLAWLYASK